jgi:hypothetical protein
VKKRWIASATVAAATLGALFGAANPAAAGDKPVPAAAEPSACSWFGRTVTHRPGFDVILWEYNCTGDRHCQVVSRGWRGKMTIQVLYRGVVRDSVTGYLIHSGDYLNTRTFADADQCGWDAQPFPP